MKNLIANLTPNNHPTLPRQLLTDAAMLTREAAIACFEWIGKGQEKDADSAAVTAMRNAFKFVDVNGTIVIGEGERDSAPMLYVGENVGTGDFKIDIAVDPLEGTTLCAHTLPNSVSVMALSSKGGLLNAPDVYMEKIAIGPGFPDGIIDLDNDPAKNIQNLANAKKCDVEDITVTILKRPRHDELVAKIREIGAKIQFIDDGDVLAIIGNTVPEYAGDIYMGIGGAPEGVLAAAALRTLGGQMQGRLIFKTEQEITRAKEVGITDRNKKYSLNELASGNVIFAATGVTDGWYLEGIKYHKNYTRTSNSVVMDSQTQTVQKILTTQKL